MTSYEVGLRTGTDDGAVSADLAVYYLDWDDIQLYANINGVGVNANGGTAVSKGAELTATARATDGLSFTVTAAYSDAYLTQRTDPVIGGLDGDPLPFVPKFTLGLGSTTSGACSAIRRPMSAARFAFMDGRPANFDNRSAGGSIRSAESSTTLDLRMGLLRERWSLEFYGKNVSDETGITDINTDLVYPNGAMGVGVIRPRTFGMSLGFQF